MTGFGVGEACLGPGRISLEARSVNHRFLDVRIRLPRELTEHTVYLEQLTRARLSRGRVDLTVHSDGLGPSTMILDRARARDALVALREVALDLGYEETPPLSILGSIPDLFVPVGGVDPDGARRALATALDASLASLDSMREREGNSLAVDLRDRLSTVCALVAMVTARAPGMVERHRDRFRDRLERLLEGTSARMDPGRLEQEAAILAEHMDVSEELTRLVCHTQQFGTLLGQPCSVGRRLDFLLQEMAREVNTLGSKSGDGEVSLRVVDLKAEIERMREQVQNVE